MPELPEVETVRAGLADHLVGRELRGIDVHSPRAVRRTPGGAAEVAAGLAGAKVQAAVRRGKFAWLLLADDGGLRESALLVHLGMSGQLLVRSSAAALTGAEHPHLRARIHLADDGVLDFVDQRTFGYLALEPLVDTADGAPGGLGDPAPLLPRAVAHIARDLLDPALDIPELVRTLRARRTAIKRALLDQTLLSGVGNIYADEALWRAGVHPERATAQLRPAQLRAVLEAAREVMTQALAQGGTSFDQLYVDVTGASGYFERSLAVYGREGQPCPRCGAPILRTKFANRSSHSCPVCQPVPGGRRSSHRPASSTAPAAPPAGRRV